jgi:hypothetical protein
MLDRALIPELLKDFVEENITDPESLCTIDTEEFLLKKSVKLGGRMKFAKEITELKKRIRMHCVLWCLLARPIFFVLVWFFSFGFVCSFFGSSFFFFFFPVLSFSPLSACLTCQRL